MVIKKKPAAKTISKSAPVAQQMIETVSVKLQSKASFGEKGIEVFVARQMLVGVDTGSAIDSLISELQPKIDAYAEEQGFDEEVEEEEVEEVEEDEEEVEEDEEEVEEDEEEVEEDDITEDEIMAMKKAELVKLIKDEELEIDPTDHKKIADLREAIIAELFVEEEEESDEEETDEEEEEWDDEEWDDED